MNELSLNTGLLRRCIKDPFPGLSHWTGALLSVGALIALLRAARGGGIELIAFSIFGGSLILLYTASALSHSIHGDGLVADCLDRLDRSAIYLLIAGTYTPVCLITLRGKWGWSVLAAQWIFATAGIAEVWVRRYHSKWVHVAMYATMGWMAILVTVPLLHVFTGAALAWLLAGGLSYSIGAVIYATDSPCLCPGVFEGHDLWHVLVLTGSACHFVMIYCFIA